MSNSSHEQAGQGGGGQPTPEQELKRALEESLNRRQYAAQGLGEMAMAQVY